MRKVIQWPWFIVFAAIYCLPGITIQAQIKTPVQTEQRERLRFALVLSRHGVRSPTWTNFRLDQYSSQPWPQWTVAPSLLTPHGRLLMTLFGGYYRVAFAEQGLLAAAGCVDVPHVYIYADTDERTVETGRALADGMLPGCTVEVHSQPEGTHDALFHPIRTVQIPDAQMAFYALSGRIGNDPAALLPAYRMPLEAMQQVLSGCAEPPCAAAAKSLLKTEPSLDSGKAEHLANLQGPLSRAATFAENLQLEYLDGMPDAQVGWGKVNQAAMQSLMALHSASSDLVQRTPYIAQTQASNLLRRILSTLDQAKQDKHVAGAIGEPGDKIVFLVGHDTNISNLAALLEAHWLVNGYQRDDAAPGGALVFELWQRTGRPEVLKVHYTVQSLEQMRNALPLSLKAPPVNAQIFLPGCSQAEPGDPCEWADFQRMVAVRLDDTKR